MGNINQISFMGADRNYEPKGAGGSKPIGEEEQSACSSKAKMAVNFEDKFRLTQGEVDPLCGAVYQRRFRPLVKARC